MSSTRPGRSVCAGNSPSSRGGSPGRSARCVGARRSVSEGDVPAPSACRTLPGTAENGRSLTCYRPRSRRPCKKSGAICIFPSPMTPVRRQGMLSPVCRRACPSGLRVRRGAGLAHDPREHGHAGPSPGARREARKDRDLLSGEGGIRTLGTLWVHTLSRRAPSAARAPLQRANRRKCRRDVQAGRGTVECARGTQCGSPSGRHGRHTAFTTSAGSAAAPPAATRRRRPARRPASTGLRRPRGEPPRRHP